MRMRRVIFIVAWAAVLALRPFGAATAGDGTVNAVSYLPMGVGKIIAVRPLDNSDENLKLQQEFERALRASGYTVSGDAALVLTFETREDDAAWSASDSRPPLLELKNSPDPDRRGLDAPQVQLNLFDSNRGGVFNRGRGVTQITARQFRLDAIVDDTRNGRRMWQGWATADVERADSFAATKSLISELVGSIGSSVHSKPVSLR